MTQENVEIVRRVYHTVARGDAAAVFDLYDPEMDCAASAHLGAASIRTRSGREGEAGPASLRHPFARQAIARQAVF